MRVAIVHDWLVGYAGGEKVLEQILDIWPDADLFSLVDFIPKENRGFLRNKVVATSSIQNLPFAKSKYRNYLPLMPFAIEQFDFSKYELVISSSHAVAKGIITGPDQFHVCYIHSPIRYAWDLQAQYLAEAGLNVGLKSFLAKAILHYIRMWDCRTSNGVDLFVANSNFIARRVKKVYGRDSMVVYPPVDISAFTLFKEKENYYITASRMVPYKKISLIVEAFSTRLKDKKLIVIGDGPDFSKIKAMAGSNVELLGYQPLNVLVDYMKRARAFVFAAEEDFGITPVEAQACGTPVIAYGKGGVLESILGVHDQSGLRTGVFFNEQSIDAIHKAVEEFEKNSCLITPQNCRLNSERFGVVRFKEELERVVLDSMALNRES